MAYEVKIYGEIISTYSKQNGMKGISLIDLQNQLALADGQEIKVRINSVGGDVQEGFAMYDELRRYAKENKVKVHTYAEAVLASIATVPFLAGDTRTVSRSISPFVHNAWMGVEGDAAQMRAAADELEAANEKIARHYSEHTDLTYKEALDLMKGNTSISSKEAVAMRFATNIEKVMRPAAMQRFTEQPTNLNNEKMIDTKKKGILAKIAEFLTGVQNKKVLAADQAEVDFYELLEDEPVEVGANATIDGKPAEGEVVMSTGETYVFAAGVLTEIKPKEEDAPEDVDNEELSALQAELAAAKSEIENLKAKNEGLSVNNKKLMGAVAKFKELESEFEDDEPTTAPKAKSTTPAIKGAMAASAVAGYTKNLTAKK